VKKGLIVIGIILLVLISSGCIGQSEYESTPLENSVILSTPTKKTQTPTTTPQTTTTTDVQGLFESKCSYCHSINRAKSKRKTKSEWEITVNRMQDVNGAREIVGLTDEEAEKIIDYLAKTYGK